MNRRGSEWRKWDLHIHSNASDGKDDCEKILKIAKEKEISVIALTDHHTVKNIDLAKQIGASLGITVISGLEFRSEYGERSVHFIGLFPETHDQIVLNTKSLTELILNPLGLSETLIVAKAKQSKPELAEDKAFKHGMFLVQVDFKQSADLIHKFGGLVVVHAGTKANSLDEEMKHKGISVKNTNTLYDSLGTVKEELFTKGYIDICEIRKENDSEDFYRMTFGKPSIVCSDAHTAEEVGSKFSWIKADPSFEGLRQILFEPQERVVITESRPERKNHYLIIDRVEIKHQDFGSQIINLNPNLNSIIGGRSSGKSILLGAIAKKIGTEKDVKKDKQEYNLYIEKEIVPNLQVHWCDGVDNTSRKIDYFPQSFINNLAADSREITSLIESIIRSDSRKRALLDEFNSKNIALKSEINNLIAEYFQGLKAIKNAKDALLALGSKEGIGKQIATLDRELSSIREKMNITLTEIEERRYSEQNIELDSLNKQDVFNKEEIAALSTLDQLINFSDISSRLSTLGEMARQELHHCYQMLSEEFRTKWVGKISELIQRNKSEIQLIDSKVKLIRSDVSFVKCFSYFQENKAYLETEIQLKSEQARLDQIAAKEKELSGLQEELSKKRLTILERHGEYFRNCIDILDQISYIKDDVEIVCRIRFQSQKFKQILGDRFVQRSYEIQAIVNYEFSTNEAFLEHLSMIFWRVLDGSIPLRTNSNCQQAIIDIFSNSFFEVVYDVLYENDSLSQMSEGKKAFIILRILLDFNNNRYPILIDQPEDDLDNRAIFDEMATYLKKIKKQRQIIVVTHNPNIVVGSDSELVICANQNGIGNRNMNDVKFEYFFGSLENTKPKVSGVAILSSQGIKEHVCDILEGGNEAFLQRERKYRLKK